VTPDKYHTDDDAKNIIGEGCRTLGIKLIAEIVFSISMRVVRKLSSEEIEHQKDHERWKIAFVLVILGQIILTLGLLGWIQTFSFFAGILWTLVLLLIIGVGFKRIGKAGLTGLVIADIILAIVMASMYRPMMQ
jgi:hypothetical protein